MKKSNKNKNKNLGFNNDLRNKSNSCSVGCFSLWNKYILNWKNKKKDSKKKIILTNYKTNFNFFIHLYGSKSFWWRLLVVFLASLIGGLISLLFIQNTGIYTYGLSGVVQGISRISKVALIKESGLSLDAINLIYSFLFYGLYIILNFPLLIYSWKKIGKKFTILSIVAILTSNLFPFFLSFIPNIESIFLFGNVTPTSPELNNLSTNYGVYLITFNSIDQAKFVSLFIYVFVSSLINGAAYSFILSSSGSTGGTDIISLAYSMRKNKSLSSIITMFNMTTILISVFIGSFLASGLVDGDYGYERFFSQNLIVAIMYSLLSSLIFSRLFPKHKIVKLTIYSNKIYELRRYLIAKKFNHSFTIKNIYGGYTMKNRKNMDIVCFYIELPKLLNDIKTCDNESFITISPITAIEGKINVDQTYD